MKAFLYARGEDIVIGHSVERLCDSASEFEPEFSERDGYYVSTRYPNSLADSIPARVYTRDAAKETVRLAEEIVEFVK